MDDLIKALQIMNLYCDNLIYPTNCSHDLLQTAVPSENVTGAHIHELNALGFFVDEDGYFASTKFGSC